MVIISKHALLSSGPVTLSSMSVVSELKTCKMIQKSMSRGGSLLLEFLSYDLLLHCLFPNPA